MLIICSAVIPNRYDTCERPICPAAGTSADQRAQQSGQGNKHATLVPEEVDPAVFVLVECIAESRQLRLVRDEPVESLTADSFSPDTRSLRSYCRSLTVIVCAFRERVPDSGSPLEIMLTNPAQAESVILMKACIPRPRSKLPAAAPGTGSAPPSAPPATPATPYRSTPAPPSVPASAPARADQ